MSAKLIRSLLSFVAIWALLFGALLYFGSGNVLEIEMKESEGHTLSPQIYYTLSKDAHFSEEKSLFPYHREGDRYFFKIPDPEKIVSVRLDPARAPRHITLRSVTIAKTAPFHLYRYRIALHDIRPAFQIERFVTTDKVTFETTGGDPQLTVTFRPKIIAKTRRFPLNTMLASLIASLLIVYLIRLSYTEPKEPLLYAKLILYALFLFFALFKTEYYRDHIAFSYPPDELAHLSYIAHVHRDHRFFPDYEHMTMINNPKSGNYLSHPPLYYELLNLVYDTTRSIRDNVRNFREIGSLLYLLAFVLLLYVGINLPVGITGHFVYLSLLSSVPMYAYIGASISNDTLAFVAAALFAIALLRLIRAHHDTPTYLLLAFSAALAFFSKLTAALLIFFALLYFLFWALFAKRFVKPSRLQLVAMAVILAPVFVYQGYILLHYHALVPTFNVTHPQEYLKSPFYVPEAYRQHLSPTAWAERLWHYIEGGWFGIHSHHSFVKEHPIEFAGLAILHLMALAALLLPCPKTSEGYCTLGKIVLFALLSVLVVQYLFSYKAHLHSGYLGGLQPRYLLPFMFGFAIMATFFSERFTRFFWWHIALIVISIHAIYSDFFYFLLYYR